MELKQLEAFVTVADLGSFSKAADRLFLTQPTMSAHVSALENELGQKLFIRTTKSLRLSPTGEKLYPYACRMLELRNAIAMNAHPETRELFIGASSVPSGYLLPAVISDFRSSHPDVLIRVRQDDSRRIEELVADGTVEIGFTGQLPAEPGIASEKLCSDDLVIIMPARDRFRQLLASSAPSESIIAALLKEPVIQRSKGSGTQAAVEDFLSLAGIDRLNTIAGSNDQESIKRMVESGMGISILSYHAVSGFESEGRLLCYPLKLSNRRSFYIIYRSGHQLDETEQSFIALAHKHYKK